MSHRTGRSPDPSRLRVKSTLQSRVDMLQNKLFFKRAGGHSEPLSQQASMTDADTDDDGQDGSSSELKYTTSLASRQNDTLKTLNFGDENFKRNVRMEIKQNKFASINKFLIAKSKMPFKNAPFGCNEPKADAQEEATQSSKLQFPRPQLPYDSRRMPSRWMAKDEDLVLTKNLSDGNADEEEEPTNVINALNRSAMADQKMKQLIDRWKQENAFSQKLSFALRQFYKNTKKDGRELGKAGYEIANFNKCLTMAALKQSIIEEQINQMQHRERGAAPLDRAGADAPRGCLNLRRISLPLRVQSPRTFIFCIVRHENRLINSQLLKCSTRHEKPTMQFDCATLLDNLSVDFQVTIQFYLMNLNCGVHSLGQDGSLLSMFYRQLKKAKFVKLLVKGKKTNSDKNALTSIFKMLTTNQQISQQQVPLVGSAFKSFGCITLDRSNSTATRFPLSQFDYTNSPSEDYAELDVELTVSYGKDEQLGHGDLSVHIESRFLYPGRISSKQLHFPAFKFSKCSLTLSGNWLKLCFKRSSHKLDLSQCLNSANFSEATIGTLPNSVCLLFKEQLHQIYDDPELNPGDPPSLRYHFIFITSHKYETLTRSFDRIMNRVMAARLWHAPVASVDDSPFLAIASQSEQQNGSDQQYNAALALAVLANIKVV